MNLKAEWKHLIWIIALFLGCFCLPVGTQRFDFAMLEAFRLVKWYAREHVLLCLVPAFFIAGAAINILAIILTARILGPQLSIARDVGAVVFSVVIGVSMAVKSVGKVVPVEEIKKMLR